MADQVATSAGAPEDDVFAFPASFAQQRLWFLDQIDPGTSVYNIPQAFHLEGPLRLDVLRRALQEVVNRHEALRTTFGASEGAPLQLVLASMQLDLPVVDLRHLPPGERMSEAQALADQEAREPFHLQKGPLIRASVLVLGADEHVLLLNVHHIVCDGWSLALLFREVSVLYAAFAAGQPSPLPDLPIQYPDYTLWQRDWLEGEQTERQLAYWKDKLGGELPVLELPGDRPRPPFQSFEGGWIKFDLPLDLTTGLAALAQRQGTSLYMTLLAAFKVLLHRLSGQDEILVGSPIANRDRAEIEEAIGFYTNTVVHRTLLADRPSFTALLGRVKANALNVYANQDVPFDKVVEAVHPERGGSHNPLFQVMFGFQKAPDSAFSIAGVTVRPLVVHSGTSKFDLLVEMQEIPTGMQCFLEYSRDLFDASTAARFIEHFRTLLGAVVQNPDRSIDELPLLTPSERTAILEGWNATRADYPRASLLHDLVVDQATRTPDAAATFFEGQRLTYRDLERRSGALAGHLRSLGVGPGVRVGLFAERSPDMVIGLLGILRAGGAYVPLDPSFPSERLAFMLADAEAPLIVTQQKLEASLPPTNARRVLLDAGPDIPGGFDHTQPAFQNTGAGDPEDPAYVIYTSGSTGKPKGVQIPHRAVVNFLTSMRREPGLSAEDRLLAITTLSFDIAGLELYLPLVVGGTVILASREVATDGPALLALLASSGATVMQATPATWRLLLDAGWEGPSSLKVLCGGEAWPAGLAASLLERASSVWNMYGPTETTIWSTCHRVTEPDRLVIGKPIANTRVHVLDHRMEPVPVGVAGELHIGGDGLATGYLKRPELTAERFVPDPFEKAGAARLYRTGDLCRFRPDGTLEFLGRLDHQVKVRGYRIELGEIEAVLSSYPGIRQTVVVAREIAPGDRRLVAYLVPSVSDAPAPAEAPDVPQSSRRATPEDLRRHLQTRLPDYMVPAAFVWLDTFPLTPNGKIDRRALPAPADGERPDLGGTFVAPRTPAEELLEGLWTDVLRVDRVGVHDDFFALGGHSLLGTRLVSRIRTALGVELPLRALFEAPTIARLAERVEAARRAGLAAVVPPVTRARRDGPLPLSFAQQRLWFLDQLEPGGIAYNIPAASRLTGTLDIPALTRAFEEILRRHEALRTTFHSEGGDPRQIIAAEPSFSLPLVDLSALPETEREAEAHRLAEQEVRRPFDLARGPLFRASLLRLGERAHVLVLVVHHVIGDAWSLGVLTGELRSLYEAFSAGLPSPLPELPVQYVDYSLWQRGWLTGEALDSQVAYWRDQLRGAPPALDLPTDRPRPPVQGSRGATHRFLVPEELSAALVALGRREGVTLFMTLLAAFQVLLHRHSGQDDIVVGSPIAGRTRVETEGLIGFFVNTLVLRASLGDDPSFRELLSRVREVTLGAYAHQDVPFEKLVEELAPARDLSRSPLFQVMLILQNAPPQASALGEVSVAPVPLDLGTAQFDLTLSFTSTARGLEGALDYSTDLFDPSTMARLASRLHVLLESVVADAEQPVSTLPLLPPEERETLLVKWNDTSSPYPIDRCIHTLFQEQATLAPDAVAVSFEGQELTYRELDARSNRLARHLVALGAGPGVLVGLAVERSPAMVTGLLGILKSGAAYVPLDPSYPADRLAFMIEDAALPLLVTEAPLSSGLPQHTARVVLLDAAEQALSTTDSAPLPPRATPTDRAYVIYTSGSTGRPKGVMIPHRAVVNFLTAMRARPGLTAADRLLAVTSLSFDIAGLELFLPLTTGARIELASRAVASDGAALRRLLSETHATVMQATPSTWRLLLDAGWEGDRALRVLVGGEAVPRELVNELVARTGAVWNMYGPTETTIWSTIHPLAAGQGPVSIGRPIANTHIHVLDRHLAPTPVGVAGELHIGGDGLATGYLGRPELTAERFVTDPFDVASGGRLYRTGDLCRWQPDGTLEFLGRLDHQVKVRGYRIELGEIESVLSMYPGVRQSVVVVREDTPGDRRLVAYVVAATPESPPPQEELRRHLQTRLPDYMVPAAFVRLDALPLTPNGKIDRRALPAPADGERLDREGTFVAPRTPTEELLAGLWTDVLRVDRVGTGDDFFALGGHSLLGTRLVSRIRAALGVELPLRALFEAPTIAGLAERIDAARRTDAGAAAPPITRARRDSPLPLSFAQQRLWFLDQLEPGSTAYNLAGATRLTGPLDVDALARSFEEIVRRHEALRTTFVMASGEPRQIITVGPPFEVPVIDLSHLPEADRETEARRLADQTAGRPFDLARGPLFRATLLRLEERSHVLVLGVHHIVGDAWSFGVLTGELTALYQAFSAGKPSPLPDLPIQYADHALWQRAWLSGPTLSAQVDHWKAQLAGAPAALELPTDRPRPAEQSYRGAAHRFVVPEPLTTALSALCRSEGVTLFMTLLAAFQVLLHRYSGQDDIVVGSPIAGRTRVETEGLIGFFVNTLVLRTRLGDDPSFRELLARVRETTLGAYAHQDVPFEKLVEELAPARDLGRSPLFQVMLILQNAPTQALALGDVSLSPVPIEQVTAQFDLTLVLTAAPHGLDASFEYNTDLFDASTVEAMAAHFQVLLDSVATDPGQAVSRLPLLTPAEREDLVVTWNDTALALPEGHCIQALFEDRARATPDATAVVFEGEELSYRELNERANRLAHHLIGLGAGPGTLVGLSVERSLGMVTGLLGILKSGAAYVPLDPSYPADRLAYMIEHAALPLLVTEDALTAELPDHQARVVLLDADEQAISANDSADPPRRATPADRAYVIYTSGSTGRPKGVMVPHRALANFLSSMALRPGLREGDTLVAVTTLSFDIAGLEMFLPLTVGARLVIATADQTGDGAELRELLERSEATVLQATPATWHLLLGAKFRAPAGFKGLCGGEALPPDLVTSLLGAGVDLWNMYGPTETTIWSTCARITPEDPRVTIGRPIHNTTVHVLDPNGQLVPTGVPGELHIGGLGVSLGYLGRPDLTAERFVPDPFRGGDAFLYRTGDLVSVRRDGNLVYHRRLDDQVKVRGHRIEPGEIEAFLSEHPAVARCVVIVREDRPGDVRLVAYVVPERGRTITASDARRHLRTRLPEYMIPQHVIELPDLPLTPAGKVARRELPAPAGAIVAPAARMPETAGERALAKIWAEVLGTDRISATDNFFDLGGHSLLSMRVVARAQAELEFQLTPRDLLLQSLEQIAAKMAR